MEENGLQIALRHWVISEGIDPKVFGTPQGEKMLQDKILEFTQGSGMSPTGLKPGGQILYPTLDETIDSTGRQPVMDNQTGRYATNKVPYDIVNVNTGTHTQMPGAPSYPTIQNVIMKDKDGRMFEMTPDGHMQPYVQPPSIQASREPGFGETLGNLLTKIPLEAARGILSAKDAFFGPPEKEWVSLPNDPRTVAAKQSPYFPQVSAGENALYGKMGVVPRGMENEQPLYGYKPWEAENTVQAQARKYGGAMGGAGTGLFTRAMDRVANASDFNPVDSGALLSGSSAVPLQVPTALSAFLTGDAPPGSNVRQPMYGPNGLTQPALQQAFNVEKEDGFWGGLAKGAGNGAISLGDFFTSPAGVAVITGGAAVGGMNEIAATNPALNREVLTQSGHKLSFAPTSAMNNSWNGIRAANSPGMLRAANGLSTAAQADFAWGLGSHALSATGDAWNNTFGSGTEIPQPIYEPYGEEWYQQLGQQMDQLGRSDLQVPYSSVNSKNFAQGGSSLADALTSGFFAGQIANHTLRGDSIPNIINPRAQGQLQAKKIESTEAAVKKGEADLLTSLLKNQPDTPSARDLEIARAEATRRYFEAPTVPAGAEVREAVPRQDGKGMEAVNFRGRNEQERNKRLEEATPDMVTPPTEADRFQINSEFEQFRDSLKNIDLSMNPANLLAASGARPRGTGRDIKPVEKDKKAPSALGVPGVDANAAATQIQKDAQLGVNAAGAAAGAPKDVVAPPVDLAAKVKGLQDELMALGIDPTTPDSVAQAKLAELRAAVAEMNGTPATPVAPAAVAPTLADIAAEAIPKPKTKPKPAAATVPPVDAAAVADVAGGTKDAATGTPTTKEGPKKQVFFEDAILPEQTDADRVLYGNDIPKSIPIPSGNDGKNFKFMVYDRKTKATQWVEADSPLNFRQARERAIEQYGDSAVVVPMRGIVPEGYKYENRRVRSESPYASKPKAEPKGPRIPEDQRAPQIKPRDIPGRDAAAVLEQTRDPRRLSYDEVAKLAEQGNQVAKDELASRQRQLANDKGDRRTKRLDGLKPEVEAAETLKKRIAEIPNEISALEAEVTELNKHAVKTNIRAKTPEGQKQMADPKNFPNGRTPEMVRREIERKRKAWSAAKSELNDRTRQQQGWVDVSGKKTLKSNAPDLTPADRPDLEEGAPKPVTPAGHRQGDMPRVSGEYALRQHKGDLSRLTNDQLAEAQKSLTDKGHTAKDRSEEGKTLRKINNALDRRARSSKTDEGRTADEDLKVRSESIPGELEAERLKLAKGIDTLTGPEKSEIITNIKELEGERRRVDDELAYRKRKETARRSTYGAGNPGGKEGTVTVPDKIPGKDKAPEGKPATPDVEAARAEKEAADRQAESDRQAGEARRLEEERAAADAEEARRQEQERKDQEDVPEDEFRSTVEEHVENLEGMDNLTQAVQKQVFGTKKKPGITEKLREAIDAYEAAKTPAEKMEAMVKVQEQLSELETIRDEMQEKSDNTPENMQGSDVFSNREDAISALDDIIQGIQDTLDIHESAGRDLNAGGPDVAKSQPWKNNVLNQGERDLIERLKNRDTPQKKQPGRWDKQGQSALEAAQEDLQRTTDMFNEAEAAVRASEKNRGFVPTELVSVNVDAYKRMQRAKERLSSVEGEGTNPNVARSPLKNGELSARETNFRDMTDEQLANHHRDMEDRLDGANHHGWGNDRTAQSHMDAAVREMQRRSGIEDPAEALRSFEDRLDTHGFNEGENPNVAKSVTAKDRAILDAHRKMRDIEMKLSEAQEKADKAFERDRREDTDESYLAASEIAGVRNELEEQFRKAKKEFEALGAEATSGSRKVKRSENEIDPEALVNSITKSAGKRGDVPLSNGLKEALERYYDKTGEKLEVRVDAAEGGMFELIIRRAGDDSPHQVAAATFVVEADGSVYVDRLDTSGKYRKNGFATGLIAEGLRTTGEQLVKAGIKETLEVRLHDASEGGASGRALRNVVGRVKSTGIEGGTVEGKFNPNKAYSPGEGATRKGKPSWEREQQADSKDFWDYQSQFKDLNGSQRAVIDTIMRGGANVERVLKSIVDNFNAVGKGEDSAMARYASHLLRNADAHSLTKTFKAESFLEEAKGAMGGSSHYSPAWGSESARGGVKMNMKHLQDPVNAIKVIMHEITHAVTHDKVNRELFGKSAGSSGVAGAQGKAYIDRLKAYVKTSEGDPGVRRLVRTYLKYLESADKDRPVTMEKIDEVNHTFPTDIVGNRATEGIINNAYNTKNGAPNQYGAVNLHEFMAEAMTNRGFQLELSRIKFNETNMWDSFKASVSQILGLNKDMAEGTLLNEAMSSTLEIAGKEQTALRAPGSEYYKNLEKVYYERKISEGHSESEARRLTDSAMTSRSDIADKGWSQNPYSVGAKGTDVFDIESINSRVGRNYDDVITDLKQLEQDMLSADRTMSQREYDRKKSMFEFEKKQFEKGFTDKKNTVPYERAAKNLKDLGVENPTYDEVMTEGRRIMDKAAGEDYEPRNLERDSKSNPTDSFAEERAKLDEGDMRREKLLEETKNDPDAGQINLKEKEVKNEEWSEQSELGDENYSESGPNPNIAQSPVRRVLREEVRVHQNAVEDFKKFVKELDSGQDSRSVLKKWGNRTVDFATVSFLQASQGELLKVAQRHNSKAVQQISGMLNGVLPGRTDKVADLGFHGEVSTNSLRFSNKLSDTLRSFEEQLRGLPTSQQRALLETIGSDVTRTGLPADPKMAKAVKEIRALYQELFYYQKRAGVNVDWAGATYIPRVLDNTKVLADRDGFTSAASDAYVMSGMKRVDADKAAQEWYKNILQGDSGFSFAEGSFIFDSGNMNGEPKHTRSRKFDKFADKVLEKYYNRNILDVTQSYIGRAVRNAELSRRFGEDFGKYQALQKRIIFGEKNQGILKEVNENVAAQLGAYGGGGSLKTAANIVNSYTAISMLPRATFSSLTEPVVMAIRSGRMTDVFKAYKDSAIQFGRQMASLPPDYQAKLAEDIGVIASHAVSGFTSSSVTNRFMGDGVNSAAGHMTSQFFRRTGLHQFTEGTRVAAVAMGETFIQRLARDVNEDVSIKQSSVRYLKELGVTDVDAFSQFVESLKGKSEADRLQAITGNRSGKAQREYRNALVKFAEQTIMNPNAGTRPRWAAHPIGAMCYNLQSYLGAFHENVTKRVMRTTVEAANLKNGLTFNDRVRMMGPLATFPVLFYAAYGLNNNVRDELFTDPARRFNEPDSEGIKHLRAMSRSNMLGRYDAIINLATNVKYDKDPATALIGPGLGALSEGIKGAKDYFSDENSKHTNTAERRGHRLLWDLAMRPPMNALMSVATPGRFTAPLGGIGIQAMSHPAIRENYVEKMAGPPVDPKNRPLPRNFLDDGFDYLNGAK